MRRRFRKLVLAALFLVLVPGGGYTFHEYLLGQVVANAAPQEGARVLRVYDGDTITLADGRRVRLLQIDTPELREGECYAYQARLQLVRLAPPLTKLKLQSDAHLDDHDRYGRSLRYLIARGHNVNVEMVRRGAATPYFYRGERGRYSKQLLKAVAEARANQRGIWGHCRVDYDPEHALDTSSR